MWIGLERESFDSEHETASPQLAGKPTHGRQLSTASASRDSGLTMSNPQLYDGTTSPLDIDASLETPSSLAPGKSAAGNPHTARSDDSVLGSPDDFSAENSEQDDATGRVPVRLRSLDMDSASRGLASAFFAQRPKSFHVETAAADDVENPPQKDDTLRRNNTPPDELTPMNSWRRRPKADPDPMPERPKRSPASGAVSSPCPAVPETFDLSYRIPGRRSADALTSYEEDVLHRELLRDDLTDEDRQLIKNRLGRKLYRKSVLMYTSQKGGERLGATSAPAKTLPKAERGAANGDATGSPRRAGGHAVRGGGLTVTLSPPTERRVSPGRQLKVVDASSSDGERSGGSPQHLDGGSRRRNVRRRASDRHPKMESSGRRVSRSKSDASDAAGEGPDTAVPRANEAVRLLVTGTAYDRRIVLSGSDTRSASSDSTVTDKEKRTKRRGAYSMKNRAWHRELVKQHEEPSKYLVREQYPSRTEPPTGPKHQRHQGGRHHAEPQKEGSSYQIRQETPASKHRGPSYQEDAGYGGRRSLESAKTATSRQNQEPQLGSKCQGQMVQGHTTKGHAIQVHATQGHTTQGHTIKGQPTQGHPTSTQSFSHRRAPTIVVVPPAVRPSSPVTRPSSASKVHSSQPPPRLDRKLHDDRKWWHASSEKLRDTSAASYSQPSSSPRKTAIRPSATVAVEPPTHYHQPRRTVAPNPVSDIPAVNWSVHKLRELYAGGGSATDFTAASASHVSASVTTVTVDKTDSKPSASRIGAVHRLL